MRKTYYKIRKNFLYIRRFFIILIDFLYYNLYNVTMKKNQMIDRLTYFSPTSLRMPAEIYAILQMDALHFGFEKNNKSNVSGFLNELLPALSSYRVDWHKDILDYADNQNIANEIEQISYSMITAQMALLRPENITVPFRVNKAHYDDFLYIHDVQLAASNLDFSEFVRGALIDYASKRLAIRERLLFYKHAKTLYSALEEKRECRCYTKKNEVVRFVPVAMFVSPYTDINVIVGANRREKRTIILSLAAITNITVQDYVDTFTPQEMVSIQKLVDEFLAEEKKRWRPD